MHLNHYVTLGRSGLRVSPLCLGTMTFGPDWGWGSDVAESVNIMEAYFAAGGNFLDTANMYTKGHSEKIIGDHLRASRRRDRVVIATKFFGGMFSGDPNGGGAGRKAIVDACHHSLRRLQTDYIDLYWMHCWDIFTPIEETMRALDDLVKAGKVRHVGFSDTPAWKCAQAQTIAHFRGWSPLIALQIEYSLLERTVEGDLIPMAEELGLGVTPWSPLKGGVLTGKYQKGKPPTAEEAKRGEWVTKHLTDRAWGILEVVQRVAREANTGAAQVALAWVRQRPGVGSTIIGARTMDQLRSNLDSLKVALTSEQTRALDEASRPALNFPYDFVKNSAMFMQGATTINGRPAAPFPLAPQNDQERH